MNANYQEAIEIIDKAMVTEQAKASARERLDGHVRHVQEVDGAILIIYGNNVALLCRANGDCGNVTLNDITALEVVAYEAEAACEQHLRHAAKAHAYLGNCMHNNPAYESIASMRESFAHIHWSRAVMLDQMADTCLKNTVEQITSQSAGTPPPQSTPNKETP